MKSYLISVFQPVGAAPAPEVLEPVMKELALIERELRDANSFVFSAGLGPPGDATVVRAGDGDVLLTDGPFVESKEYLGGFTVITAPDHDTALRWGARFAAATTLPIEVRPFRD